MNLNQLIYSVVSAAILTYVAHHTGTADVGVAVLALVAHLLHVPVTTNGNGNGQGFSNGSH